MQDFRQESSALSLPCGPVAGTVGRGDSGTRPEVEEMGGKAGQKHRTECGGEGEEQRTAPGFWFVTETTTVPALSQ